MDEVVKRALALNQADIDSAPMELPAEAMVAVVAVTIAALASLAVPQKKRELTLHVFHHNV